MQWVNLEFKIYYHIYSVYQSWEWTEYEAAEKLSAELECNIWKHAAHSSVSMRSVWHNFFYLGRILQHHPAMCCTGQSNMCKQTFLVDYFVTWPAYFYSLPREWFPKIKITFQSFKILSVSITNHRAVFWLWSAFKLMDPLLKRTWSNMSTSTQPLATHGCFWSEQPLTATTQLTSCQTRNADVGCRKFLQTRPKVFSLATDYSSQILLLIPAFLWGIFSLCTPVC